jgi:hypothetical protein
MISDLRPGRGVAGRPPGVAPPLDPFQHFRGRRLPVFLGPGPGDAADRVDARPARSNRRAAGSEAAGPPGRAMPRAIRSASPTFCTTPKMPRGPLCPATRQAISCGLARQPDFVLA